MKTNFPEIRELYDYCIEIGIDATLEHCWDGWSIRFPSGSDFVQHSGSYGSDIGCVEPAIGCRLDYRAVPLKNAKALVKYHKDRLNRRRNYEE